MESRSVADILEEGLRQGASDWHFREGRPVCVRVAGTIRALPDVADREFMLTLFDEVVSAEMRERYDLTGDADFAFHRQGVGRFRVNLHRQRGQMAFALRHVKERVPSLPELGLPPILLDLAEARNGIVFVSGSTGAGKSTTLACMIEHINRVRPCHIVTIEDPIEYYFEDRTAIVQQREVGLDTVSFESGLRHALRQDPDVIVIGELRSRDSFESALAAAETGHLVLTTLHTTTAGQSINRILDFYDYAERDAVRANLAGNLRAIVCQRLIPNAEGSGLVPINEVMLNTPTVRNIIIENTLNKLYSAISAGLQEGMQTFNYALLQLVQEGTITEETALAFASNPDALRMNMQGIFLTEDSRIVNA